VVARWLNHPWRLLAAALIVAAAGCGIAAAATWSDPNAVEGVYINRSVGSPGYVGLYSGQGVADGRLWLGVAIGLAIAAAMVLAVSIWDARRRSVPAPGP
jgi:hypothetical protein